MSRDGGAKPPIARSAANDEDLRALGSGCIEGGSLSRRVVARKAAVLTAARIANVRLRRKVLWCVAFVAVSTLGLPRYSASQTCSGVNCDDGLACTVDYCLGGQCYHRYPDPWPSCDDGNVCNGREFYDCATAQCISGPAMDCDDGLACTLDACDPAEGCLHTPRAQTCDDGDRCNGIEYHDCATDDCVPGVPPHCDDGIECTIDYCDPVDGCIHEGPRGDCSDGDVCNGEETYDCATDSCISGTPLVCDDGDPCTRDSCQQVRGCEHETGVIRDCDDGNACNGIESFDCVRRECVRGAPLSCDDALACTVDSCDPLTGQCVNIKHDRECDDGDPCNGFEYHDCVTDTCYQRPRAPMAIAKCNLTYQECLNAALAGYTMCVHDITKPSAETPATCIAVCGPFAAVCGPAYNSCFRACCDAIDSGGQLGDVQKCSDTFDRGMSNCQTERRKCEMCPS